MQAGRRAFPLALVLQSQQSLADAFSISKCQSNGITIILLLWDGAYFHIHDVIWSCPPLPRLNCYCTDGYCIIVNNEQNFLCFRFSQVANHYHCFAAFTQNVYCSCLCIWVKEYLFRNAGWKSTSRAEALAVKRPVCTVNAPSSHQAPGLRER